ncbi:MAG: hypothetical protein U0840_07475 [Gemmataceae bacterium]
MLRVMLRLVLGLLLLAAALPVASAQDKEVDLDEFRRLRRLETPLDFWNAVQFELDLGKPDIAARYLRGLVTKKPGDKELFTILDKDGLTSILKLRNIRIWSSDKKENEQAMKDAEMLIEQATAANQRRMANDERIRELIGQLQGTPEEKVYAIQELYKIGDLAVPHFIDTYLRARDATDRNAVLQAMYKMGPETLAPLLAALDTDNPLLKVDLLDILRTRHARASREIVPFLHFLAASKKEAPAVREKARRVLADFLELPPDRLPLAKAALTREAERYYQHQVNFGDPRAVKVWRWDGKRLVPGWPNSPTITASQAEQYYGQRFARQALQLDPDYRPAQLAALSLAVDKGMEKAGPTAPISRTSPQEAELLARADSALVLDMLERALKENRTPVVLAAVRALGDRAEVTARRAIRGNEPALVRALYYPDPRVQLAAAVALLQIPGPATPKTAARIVEILGRTISPAAAYLPGRKVLVALTDEGLRDRVRQVVSTSGAQPVVVMNGRDAMRQLRGQPEIEAIVMDSTLPYPGLSHLLAEMRQDVDVGRIPIILAAIPESRAGHDAAIRFRQLRARIESINQQTESYRAILRKFSKDEAIEKTDLEKDFSKDRRITQEDKMAAYRRIEEKFARKRQEIAHDFPSSIALLNELPRLEKEMAQEVNRYELESQLREAALERHIERCKYANVRLIHTGVLTDARSLEAAVLGNVREAGVNLTAEEQRGGADLAMEWLANLAEGKPEGYDVRPVANTILEAVRAGRLSPEGRKAGIRIAQRLEGEKPQAVLAVVILDGGAAADMRIAAVRALILNIQRQGLVLSRGDQASLIALAGQANLDPRLKDQVVALQGVLRPGERGTGERLRDFTPTPAAAVPPPPEKKEPVPVKEPDKKDPEKEDPDKKDPDM